MEITLSAIRTLWATLIGWTASILLYFTPIHDMIDCIFIVYALNFIVGYITGLLVQRESFVFKKAFNAFIEAGVYILILTLVFVLSEKMKGKWLFQFLSILTWSWIYFYIINLLKNFSRLMPGSKGIRFAYFVLSFEIIKHVPYLKKFEQYEKNESKKCKQTDSGKVE